jgi:hypothetical protein
MPRLNSTLGAFFSKHNVNGSGGGSDDVAHDPQIPWHIHPGRIQWLLECQGYSSPYVLMSCVFIELCGRVPGNLAEGVSIYLGLRRSVDRPAGDNNAPLRQGAYLL